MFRRRKGIFVVIPSVKLSHLPRGHPIGLYLVFRTIASRPFLVVGLGHRSVLFGHYKAGFRDFQLYVM